MIVKNAEPEGYVVQAVYEFGEYRLDTGRRLWTTQEDP
jgi:hypothetical protein